MQDRGKKNNEHIGNSGVWSHAYAATADFKQNTWLLWLLLCVIKTKPYSYLVWLIRSVIFYWLIWLPISDTQQYMALLLYLIYRTSQSHRSFFELVKKYWRSISFIQLIILLHNVWICYCIWFTEPHYLIHIFLNIVKEYWRSI